MVHLSIRLKLCVLFDLALGFLSNVINPPYIFLILSLVFLFIILILNADFRYHETIYLFVYSIIICFPFNLRMSMTYIDLILEAELWYVQALSLGIIMSAVLMSIEEIILCLIGYLIWGEQDTL